MEAAAQNRCRKFCAVCNYNEHRYTHACMYAEYWKMAVYIYIARTNSRSFINYTRSRSWRYIA